MKICMRKFVVSLARCGLQGKAVLAMNKEAPLLIVAQWMKKTRAYSFLTIFLDYKLQANR